MNSKNIIATTDHTVCMKCLRQKANHQYNISNRGYGSSFDMGNTHLQLCKGCHKEEYEQWFNECDTGYDENGEWVGETYEYEENILELIHSLPLESQELFYNTFMDNGDNMESQDWIDYQLGELQHDRCKDYRLYSTDEIKAYHDRFPTCDKVFKKVYGDGSSCCWCSRDANGNSDGTCGENISSKCYMCTQYELRKDAMKEINEVDEFYKNEKERLENMLEYAKSHLEELENSDLVEYMNRRDL